MVGFDMEWCANHPRTAHGGAPLTPISDFDVFLIDKLLY